MKILPAIPLFVVLSLLPVREASALPAFPGAEGYGSETPGGRGGRVVYVTTLDDSGPGSLREALTAPGPRVVVFRVGGTIRLRSRLVVTEPFVTVAGQTAPGDGILLRDAGLYIETHDVVVRFVRVRIGPSLVERYGLQDPIHVEGEDCYNVVVDHCSFSWSIDECGSARGPARDVTFSYCIFGEALRRPLAAEQTDGERNHSMGFILSGEPTRCTLRRCLVAHCDSRNPRIQGGRHDIANNVVYDWTWLTGTFSRNPDVNFIGNYYKPGGFSLDLLPISEKDGQLGRVYVRGNRSPHRPSDDLPEWALTVNADAAVHEATQPFAMPPMTLIGAEEAYEAVLAEAGAVLPRRDTVDTRIVRQVRLGMGTTIDRPEEVGGFPVMAGGEAPADTDSDGMPDAWETANGLDPNDMSDGARVTEGGYTQLETYLESLLVAWREREPLVETDPPPKLPRIAVPFTVRVGGRPVVVAPLVGSRSTYLARVRVRGAVRAEVELARMGVREPARPSLEPARYRLAVEPRKNGLAFDVTEPGLRLVFFDHAEQPQPTLVLLVEPVVEDAPVPGAPGLTVVKAGAAAPTAAIQRALDTCAEQGGGTVLVEAGVYRVGPLHVGDRTRLYLAPGAVLEAEGDQREGTSPGRGRLIEFANAHDASLGGPGTLVGGPAGEATGALVRAETCRDVTVESVLIRDCAGRAVEFAGCAGVCVRGVRIVNDPAQVGSEGLVFDGCREVRLERFAACTHDRALAIRASGAAEPAENLTVRDVVLCAHATAMEVVADGSGTLRAVRVGDADIVRSGRGFALTAGENGTVEAVHLRDVTIDAREATDVPASGAAARIAAEAKTSLVRDLTLDRVSLRGSQPVRALGHPDAWLADIKFWGCAWHPQIRPDDASAQPVVQVRHARDVQFRFAELDWSAARPDQWTTFLDVSDVTNLRNTEMREVRP